MQALTNLLRILIAIPVAIAGLAVMVFGVVGFFLGHTVYVAGRTGLAFAFVMIVLLLLVAASGIWPKRRKDFDES